MRILHLYKDYYPVLGGIENYIKVLAEAHAAQGHQVTVLVCAPGPRSEVKELHGVRIYRAARLATAASMPLSLQQPLRLARLQADVIHLHAPYPLGEVSAWLLKRRTPWVMTYQSDIVRQKGWLRLYAPLLRRILQRVDRILVTSPRYLETSSWLRPVRDRCVVSPMGVDSHSFCPPEAPYQGPPRILFVGQLRYYKGLGALLQALPLLPPETTLDIVGKGPMLAEWQSLAAQLGITSRVRFLGEIPHESLPDIYRRATLFVLPSNARSEAFGMVL
ncbi:MAG TPA: glycosyltransferase, partial [Chloroflexi bacterium]|nr:glycosyltransferase [Chloroflexota bacterium]